MNLRTRFEAILILSLQVFALLAAGSCALIYANEKSVAELSASRRWISDEALKISIGPEEFAQIRKESGLFLLDTRNRKDFAAGHISGAHNIPLLELAMRFPREVPQDKTLVVYCGSSPTCEQNAVVAGKPTMCGIAIRELRHHVPKESVRILVGLIPEFPKQGINVTTTAYALRLASLNEQQ
jgi:hypothetical protein